MLLRHTEAVNDDVRESLLARQAEITSLVQDLTAHLDAAGDSANRSRGDRYGLSTELHSQASTLQELRQQSAAVERALAKIDDDSYGVCDSCGTAIPPARLEIHPWAVLCVPCAEGG